MFLTLNRDIFFAFSVVYHKNRQTKDFFMVTATMTIRVWQYIHGYFVERYIQEAKINLGTDILSTQIIFSIRLYCYGTVGMTREWLLNDNITPAETVVEMMFNSMPQELRRIYPLIY